MQNLFLNVRKLVWKEQKQLRNIPKLVRNLRNGLAHLQSAENLRDFFQPTSISEAMRRRTAGGKRMNNLIFWAEHLGGGSNPLIRHFLNIDRSQNNID
ncbi:MAG: hypothetical protein ACTFAK_17210 [Candidatus Electronema sp. VV]